MYAPKFADSYNMVAFLAKSTESDRFEQILDFLNANPLKYALTVNPTIYTSCIEQFWATEKVKTINGEVQLQALVDGKKVIITETSVRRDLKLEDSKGIECLPNADIFEQLALMGMVKNIDSSVKFLMYPRFVKVFLDKQVSDMSTHDEIFVTPSHTKKIKKKWVKRKYTKIPQSIGLTKPIADKDANEENVPTHSNDPPLSRVNTLRSGEDRLTLKELMDLCTKLSDRVLDLETIKTVQAKEIASLKKRVKKLERKRKSKTPGMKRLFKIEVTLVNETQGRYDDAQMFNTYVFDGKEVFVAEQSEKVVEEVVSTAKVSVTATITTEEITLAQALAKLRSAKPKAVMKEQIRLDEELALKLQAKEEEQAILARKKAEKVEEANISWDNVQAMIEADRLLAERLQAKEQEELTNKEKARLFVELLEKRKKHFAALRAQEKRNKPPTKAQNKTMTRVNMFVDKATELVKESSKKAEAEMEQESSLERAEEVAIDAIPLATKPPSIIDWKISKEGKIGLFQIIRANGSSKRYSLMIHMLRDFDREDLETLWKLVKAKHGNTRPEEGYERVLWGNLRTMFEHNIEDTVWRNLLGNKVFIWKLIDSCGVHFVRFQDMHLFMLAEKKYPLTPATIAEMLNKKL
ncbi:hypothetical protein Tco_1498997 [Tanacetum coccineum]